MRIAYFTDTYLPQINGVTNTLGKLGNYLTANNIKHMVFAPEYTAEPEISSPSPACRFKSISSGIYPECRLSIPFYPNFCRLVDKFKPDLIHLVTPMGIGLAGLRYARENNIPLVSSFHTNFDVYLKYYRLEYIEDIIWNYFRWFHSFCRINFCPSQDTMETLSNKGIENLKIWSRGIDTNTFNPFYRDLNLRKKLNSRDKISFLYAGRLAAEKDLDILSQSIKNIVNIYPGRARFILVGDGPLACSLRDNLGEDVIFTGYLKGRELSAMYASADVFVFPSSTETLGNVVLEAMASGLPVVAVNSGGVKENVIHNYNGILCKPRDVESFTCGISEFLNNTALISSIGANARQYTLTKTWNKIFDKLISDYYSAFETKADKLIKTA